MSQSTSGLAMATPGSNSNRLLGTVNIPKGCDKEGALRLGAPSLGGNARTVHVPRES